MTTTTRRKIRPRGLGKFIVGPKKAVVRADFGIFLLQKNEPTFFGEEVNICVMLNRQYMQEIFKVTLSLMYLQFRISEGSIWKYISHQSLQQQQIQTSCHGNAILFGRAYQPDIG